MQLSLSQKSSHHVQSCVFWNVLSSGLNSIVSIILLFVVTRIKGTSDAGIFSLAFSTAQMMLTIGNYGMRNYQATDIKGKYNFFTYFNSRITTSFIMLFTTIGFVLIRKYTTEEILIFISLCLLKITDAFDDLYGGFFQNKDRLDISGKLLFFRVLIYCILFSVTLLISKNLLLAICIAILSSIFTLIGLLLRTENKFHFKHYQVNCKKILQLLYECFPLCLGSFLLVYLGNAPKYSIDTYLTNDMQAVYTYLFMPCFVINLFVSFALQPILVRLSLIWEKRKFSDFLKNISFIYLIAIGISVIITISGKYLGCTLLGIVFDIDLSLYHNVLSILLIGGGFYSLSVIGQIILTIMRHQYATLWGFGISSVFVTIISPILVKHFSLLGAAVSYSLSAALLCMILLLFIIIYYNKEKKIHRSKDSFPYKKEVQ